MTDTRKQIIDLIGDYMDKTLSDGCYIEVSNYNNEKIGEKYLHKIVDSWKYKKDENCNKYDFSYMGLPEFNHYGAFFLKLHRIIGHYDITALLKFIYNRISYDSTWITDEFIYFNKGYYADEILKIPNKLLHLYTDEEDKDVYKILTNLK